jgi:hypothetical protein
MKHTSGPFKVAILRDDPARPATVDEIKKMLCNSVDRTVSHGDSVSDFHLVLSSDDPADPVFIAITGNGPGSEGNAHLIAGAVTSYDKHCADPIAAAEGDLLGEAVRCLRLLLEGCEQSLKDIGGCDHQVGICCCGLISNIEAARAILKKVKR